MKDKCDFIWKNQERIREFSPTYNMRVFWLRKVLKKLKGRVLDIGCGNCSIIKFFDNPNVSYIGIDHSDIAVKKAKEKGYEVYKKSASSDFKFKEKFDYILSIDMLEHIKDDEKVIQRCYKNLKSHGKLVLTTCLQQRYFGALDEEAGHYRRYNPDTLVEMIKNGGFRIEKVYYFGFPLCHLYRMFQQVMGKKERGKVYGQRYVPSGRMLKVALKVLPFVNPLFKIDNLFSSKLFKKFARGIVILAVKK